MLVYYECKANVENAIENDFGRTLFLNRPTPPRLAAWRAKAQNYAVKEAGYAYASYGQLKLSGIADELVTMLRNLANGDPLSERALRAAIWSELAKRGLNRADPVSNGVVSEATIQFLREHDLQFRIRRLRFMLRRLVAIEESGECDPELLNPARDAIYDTLGDYLDRERREYFDESAIAAAENALADPGAALEMLAAQRDLKPADDRAEELLSAALAELPKAQKRTMLFAYLGFPFYDIATLPLLQGEGLDEFDPVKVDRIAPEDAQSIRQGGAEETLKGIEFNSFGAFFSRAYRENDYLWGRLHGAERLIDILVSTTPEATRLPDSDVAEFKQRAFRAILDEEQPRLTHIGRLFEELDSEIG